MKLKENEKNALSRNQGKVIIYYWASWCLPCLETMSTMRSEDITFNNEKYRLLFISEDESQTDWLSKSYPILNSGNSFRLGDFDNIFYKTFQITAIPRVFLFDEGVLVDQNLNKSMFQKMIKKGD